MKQAILDLITKRHGSVSFVELSHEVAGFDGNMELTIGDNIVLWWGVSAVAAKAIEDLRSSGAIHVHPTTAMVYLIDGTIPRLPIAKRAGPYKSPHWLPVVFIGPMPPPKPKIPVARPNQITPTKLNFTAMNAADLRAHFEPLELCPNGFNSVPGECAKGWDHYDTSPAAGKELVRQIADAAEWLALCDRRKSINRDATSYGLKHECERWRKARYPSRNYYVSNGALLMAAVGLGFRIQRPSAYRNFPNAYLNIARRRP